MIESTSNAQMKKIQKLKKSAKFRRQEHCFIVEGFKMVEEALRYKKARIVYVSEDAMEEWQARRIEDGMKSIRCEEVSTSVFRQISDTETPQGVLALVEMPEYDRDALLEAEHPALICLEDVQDPGNLGTIMRTAEGAGMTAVVMTKGCVDLFNPKVVRSTMGAMFRMPFYIVESMTEEIRHLQGQGFTVYSSQLDGSRNFTECQYQGKVGILVGNEANGIRPETSACANEKIHIPMEGEVESLNAAVSAALLMYEVHRKRRK
nr:RNA methyltransferase [Eubacterium sp.]